MLWNQEKANQTHDMKEMKLTIKHGVSIGGWEKDVKLLIQFSF